MPLKVTWKKGMRLSTDVFNSLDSTIDENIRLTTLVGTAGRYGLFPTIRPFELSVNINNNILEVVSLSCHGVTKSGKLVDIEFDSNYTVTFDTRVPIPAVNGDSAFILVVKMKDKEWREVTETHSEPFYTFELVGENNIIDNDSLPIGCMVNQYGWRLNETDFVPPCLYVGAHRMFMELLDRAKAIFRAISDRCLNAQNCIARYLLSLIWSEILSAYITLDKERNSVTPEQLYALVQKVIGAFVIGCSIDEHVSLENADPFVRYIQKPYDARHIYRDIEDGLELAADISVKMDAVCNMTEPQEIPVEKPRQKTPQPPVQETKQETGRNRWAGIEI